MSCSRMERSGVSSRPPLRQPKCALRDEPESANVSLHAQPQGLIKKALHDLNALSTQHLTELVTAICQRPTEGTQNREPAVQLCFFLIGDSGGKFLHMLLSTCSEWFDKRDQLLRPLNELKPVPRRLTAFVSFLTELLLGLRGRSGEGEVMNSTRFLAELLCECCHDILQIPSLGNASEIWCLRWVLTRAGKAIEHDDPELMKTLMQRIKEAFLQQGLSALGRKTLLELIELRATGWQLNLGQQKYYDDTLLEVEADMATIFDCAAHLFNLAAF